ncbi:non-homologous end-joining DNA ligase [Microvirga rosea]|uniref:non-homologous end-joining DNA ligase n=1 Tax=Microvirga rosea TaxID=2715425 RepID=UPI001D09FFD6|nr:non-homologous end-joining DNA ligase [Microvirga rosea]MCB8821248.1 non-homologous end-joining DNA ligase [Microvirga rosea]
MAKSRPSARRNAPSSQVRLPRKIPVELAVLEKRAPEGDQWFHEAKFDGYRMLARIEEGKSSLVTRTDQVWTDRFPEIAETFAGFAPDGTVFDGEICKLTDKGLSSFAALQQALSNEDTKDLVYYAFDLLFHEGADLRQRPLEERKRMLAEVLASAPPTIILSQHQIGNGPAIYARACSLHMEGIVSKHRASTYSGTRSPYWLKTKCLNTEEFVIIGYTDPQRSRIGFGALLVGYYAPSGELVYAGKVGTGFTADLLLSMHESLKAIERQAPTAILPKGTYMRSPVHWVEPWLVAQVEFTEWTRDNILRHPSFLGLREDKPPTEIIIERPKA